MERFTSDDGGGGGGGLITGKAVFVSVDLTELHFRVIYETPN